jgi:two-component system, chemotaxis family, chemotaxis protein CheY
MTDLSFRKLDILVADSSSHMASLVAQMLWHLRVHDVAEAVTSEAALALLRARKFNAVIIDDLLNPMDGIALTRVLRSSVEIPNRDIPIIMMSATPDATRIVEARDAGITEFLRKPFAAQHVATRLHAILSAPRPFITAEAYVGPDRRRKKVELDGPDRRH